MIGRRNPEQENVVLVTGPAVGRSKAIELASDIATVTDSDVEIDAKEGTKSGPADGLVLRSIK